jgi:hypothetical protein
MRCTGCTDSIDYTHKPVTEQEKIRDHLMKKNYLAGLLAASALAVLTIAGPVMAQDGSGSGQSSDRSASSTGNEQQGDNNNWGWLGLLGLAGLAGLRKPAPTVVRQDKDGAARAY